MKKINIYIMSLLLCGSAIGLSSCEEYLESPAMPTNLKISPVSGSQGELLTIRGTQLSKIQKITFGSVVAAFNPVYNTDSIILLRVPTDAGFGSQKVTLLNAGGDELKATIDFKVLQPTPLVLDFAPLSTSPGELVTINGNNFTGKGFSSDIEVLVGTSKAEIVSLDKTKIVIKMPAGDGGPIKVVTGNTNVGGGESISKLALTNENIFHMIADFDGGGSSDKSYWYTYGDVDGPFKTVSADPAPKSGKFMKMSNLKGFVKDTYMGASHDDAIKYDVSKVTTANTAIRLDVNSNGKKGTELQVTILDEFKGNWAQNIKCDWDGWKSVTFKLSDLYFSYGTKKGDKIDGSKVKRVTVGFINYKGVESELNIDNIRLIETK